MATRSDGNESQSKAARGHCDGTARALRWHGKAPLCHGRAKHGYDDHNRIGSVKHGKSLDSHRDGMDRVRTARALLRVAMALLCKARHRHGKGS